MKKVIFEIEYENDTDISAFINDIWDTVLEYEKEAKATRSMTAIRAIQTRAFKTRLIAEQFTSQWQDVIKR